MSPFSLLDVSLLRARDHSIADQESALKTGTCALLQPRSAPAAASERSGHTFALTGAIFAGILMSFGALAASQAMFSDNAAPAHSRSTR